MWQGGFTVEALKENWLVAVDRLGGTPEAEAISRGQLKIVRMKGQQTILGVCYTWYMLHSVYAALSVNSWWWYGEMERDEYTLCSCDDGRVVDGKERDGGWRWERYGG